MSRLAIGIALAAGVWAAGVRADDSAVVVAAPTNAAVAAPAPAAAAQAAPELVCHIEKPMGSNIGKRVCRTRAVIKAEQEQAHEALNRVDQARNTSDPG